MSVRAVLLGAKKALGALAVGEAAAVEAGLIGGATAGYVTAGLGVASAVVVYLLNNVPKDAPHLDIDALPTTAPAIRDLAKAYAKMPRAVTTAKPEDPKP